jgi:PAS domain S-box-containing protein
MKAITLALVITLSGFIVAGWHIWKSYTGYKTALSRDYRFQFLIKSLNSGPTMTNIVRNATKTGNLDEENVYLYLAKEVDDAIRGIKRIAPNSQIRDIAAKVDESNTLLIDIEKRAFDLVRQGRLQEAKDLVYSQEYKDNINNYDTGNYNISESLRQKVENEVLSLRKRTFFAFVVVVGSIPVLIFVWIVVLSMMRRYLIERSHQESVNAVFASLELKLSAVSTPNEVALEVIKAADELFGWDASYVALYGKDEDKFYSVLNFDVIEGERQKILSPPSEPEKSFFLRLVLSEGAKLVLRKKPEDDAKYKIIPFGDTLRLSRSLMFVPIRKGDKNVGVVSIQSYSKQAYDDSDLDLFQSLADHCSGALDRTFAQDKLRQQELFTRHLSELGKNIATATTPRDAATMILDTADELFGWDACYINFYSQDDGTVYDVLSMDTIDGKRVHVSPVYEGGRLVGISKRTIEEGPQLILRDRNSPLQDCDLTPFGDTIRRSASLMFTPVRKGANIMGVLSIQSYKYHAYTRNDLEILQILADHCSGALHRTLAETKLLQSEEKLRLLTEQIPALLWTTDKDLRFTLLRGAGFRALKLDPGQLIGKTLDEFFKIRDLSLLPVAMHAGALQGISANYEMELMGKYFDSYVEPLHDVDGEVIGCVCVAHDITERKFAEEELKKFKMAIEQIANSVIIYNRRLTIEYVNREFETLTDYTREEMIGKTLQMFIPDHQNPGLYERLLHTVRSGSVFGGVVIKQKKNGELYYDEATITPLKDSHGHITHFVETGKDITERIRAEEDLRQAHEELEKRVDERTKDLSLSNTLLRQEITERKRAEQDLAHSEEIYREAIENASGVPYRFLYEQQSYEFMGKEIQSLIGYSPEEFSFDILDQCIQEIIILDPDVPEKHSRYVQSFKRGELDQYRVDLRVKTKNGDQKWISDCSVPIRDESNGKVIGSLGILQDITKRKQVEEQARLQQEKLIHADKMVSLGILVSGVAHEINNPNNFIMLNTPILLESWESVQPILEQYYNNNGDFVMGGLNYSEMREHIPVLFSGIVEGSQRIKNIVQELRDFARQYPAEVKDNVKMNDIVNSSLTLLSNMIKKSTDYFHVQYGTDLPPLKGNFQRLEQVLINLIQNSCQALPDRNRAIYVSTSFDKNQDSIVVQVKDEGVGIHPEMLKHIMDPFFTTKRDSGGTGLGLSISANIVNEHGGKIIITSEKDKGTVVSVILPLNIQTSSVNN